MAANERVVWEQRWHPLREEWVLYTAHRGGRPWLGETKKASEAQIPAYDPTCALCPGNRRLHGVNPPYTGTFWFTNDLPCFGAPGTVPEAANAAETLRMQRSAYGTAEVVCYHPNHNRTFADLETAEALAVVNLWRERYVALGALDYVNHVLIFENKGELVGTSNPHPHCQIYASSLIYEITEREARASRRYFQRFRKLLGQAIMEQERNDPEIMIEVAVRYDNLWRMPMPYVMAIHQAPTDGQDHTSYPFHIEYHPPLRKPDTMKYLAGPEIGGGTMTNESDPDAKAEELRNVSSVLYRKRMTDDK
jgi:UDPglucose--hexose-1-phosphate uridylyltransferase